MRFWLEKCVQTRFGPKIIPKRRLQLHLQVAPDKWLMFKVDHIPWADVALYAIRGGENSHPMCNFDNISAYKRILVQR